jgi:predicted DNA-binding protein (UPF0251 family)
MVQDRLLNWARWCNGWVGPARQTRAASAEGNYIPELGEVWEPDEIDIEIDELDAEKVEKAITVLGPWARKVLRFRFVDFPDHQSYTIAQRLRISTDRFESELKGLMRRLEWMLSEQKPGYRQDSAS